MSVRENYIDLLKLQIREITEAFEKAKEGKEK